MFGNCGALIFVIDAQDDYLEVRICSYLLLSVFCFLSILLAIFDYNYPCGKYVFFVIDAQDDYLEVRISIYHLLSNHNFLYVFLSILAWIISMFSV